MEFNGYYLEILDFTDDGKAHLRAFFDEHGKQGLIAGAFEEALRKECLAVLEDNLNDDAPLAWELRADYTEKGRGVLFSADPEHIATKRHEFDLDNETEFTFAIGEDTTLNSEWARAGK